MVTWCTFSAAPRSLFAASSLPYSRITSSVRPASGCRCSQAAHGIDDDVRAWRGKRADGGLEVLLAVHDPALRAELLTHGQAVTAADGGDHAWSRHRVGDLPDHQAGGRSVSLAANCSHQATPVFGFRRVPCTLAKVNQLFNFLSGYGDRS